MKNFIALLTVFIAFPLLHSTHARAQSMLQSLTPLIPIQEVFSPVPPLDLTQFVKVAVVQWNPYFSAPVGAPQSEADDYLKSNREAMSGKIEIAAKAGARFIVLSEFAVVGYPDIPELPSEEDEFRNRDDIKPFVDTIPGNSTAYFSQVAVKNNVWIQFGMAEVDPATDIYYNAAVVINSEGLIVAKFRKNNLYGTESNFLSPGTEPVVFDSPVGKVGLVICADIYHTSLLQKYKDLGVNVLSLSASWAGMNTAMDAFKNAALTWNVYVMASNQTYFPDSGVVNPNGSTQSHIRQTRDGIAYGYLPSFEKATTAQIPLQRSF